VTMVLRVEVRQRKWKAESISPTHLPLLPRTDPHEDKDRAGQVGLLKTGSVVFPSRGGYLGHPRIRPLGDRRPT
jgi:hypothetical protein